MRSMDHAQKKFSKVARRLSTVCLGVALISTLAGCLSPATPDTESHLSGSYLIADQSANHPIALTKVQVHFNHSPDGISSGRVTITVGSGERSFTFSECGAIGTRMVTADDRSMVEAMLCKNGAQGPRFPQISFDASKDGRPIGYSPAPLDFSNHAIKSDQGRIMIIFWYLNDYTAFALEPN